MLTKPVRANHSGINAQFLIYVVISSNLFAATNNQYCYNDIDQHHIGYSSGKLQSAALINTGVEVELTRPAPERD